jgi:hypothetical protein
VPDAGMEFMTRSKHLKLAIPWTSDNMKTIWMARTEVKLRKMV